MRFECVIVAGSLVACTSFDEPRESGTDGGALDGAAADGGAPIADAGADAASLLGPSDPDIVECNAASSDPGDQRCKTSSGAGCCYPSTGPRCNLTCANPWISCDETADCKTGLICCGSITLQTRCEAACATTRICKSDSECDGAACDAYECFGRIIGMCSNSAKLPPPTQCTRR